MGLLSLVLNFVPGLLMLAAPGPYRDDRFPGWDLHLAGKKKSFLLLCLSECVGSLVLFPSTIYVTWWFSNGWSEGDLGVLSVLFAALLAIGFALWAKALSVASVHGFSFLIGVVILLAPPMLLRNLCLEEVSTFTSLGRSDAAILISMVSLLLEGIRSSAIWTAKIKILNSNWRLLSYGSILMTITHICSAASPWLCEKLARSSIGASFISRNQKELADAAIVCLVPFCIAQAGFQLLAAPCIHKEMGVQHSDRLPSCRCPKRRLLPLAFATVASVVLAVSVILAQQKMLHAPMPYEPVYRCSKQAVNCSVLLDETNVLAASRNTWTYGPNRYGQSTTGKYNCRMRMSSRAGDTFVFSKHGRCQVLLCGTNGLAVNSVKEPEAADSEIWSRHCSMSGQNLVAVHLFEWPWEDIGQECETQLGPAGVSMVQISPPAEHILGDGWGIRYQPVSYRLESRSGDRDAFVHMVARCNNAGVAVMVDAVMNHMASPFVYSPLADRGKVCGSDKNTSKYTTRKCVGWAGTEFGNRLFPNGRPLKDAFYRKHFHHYPANDEANCGLPPWTNNMRLCDLNGLPDLDTESLEVQNMLAEYLFELYEIGVTMLRMDAAMLIYPESLAQILRHVPWDYIVQEYYPGQLPGNKAFMVGSVTNMDFGIWMAQTFFDSGSKDDGFTNRSSAFQGWLQAGRAPRKNCGYAMCGGDVPENFGLIFLDNHDSQRERWKQQPGSKPSPVPPVCNWDGFDIGSCRLNYKYGMQYSLASRFMLAWPYGDAVKLMSSYAWKNFDDGPPGIAKDSLRQNTPSPVICRGTPTSSPVKKDWDEDSIRWVCEHRWQGILGMVRFRRVVGKTPKVHSTWHLDEGFIGFSLGDVAFVAVSRGFNSYTGLGSNRTLDLAGLPTPLSEGLYCNMASEYGPVPEPERWSFLCTGGDPVEVNASGFVVHGSLPSGGMVALHTNYTFRGPADYYADAPPVTRIPRRQPSQAAWQQIGAASPALAELTAEVVV